MHAIHTTPGFIIDSRAYGEAGKLISIFTRDLGLISASAAGIRFERSKLRYFTQDHSFGSFSLVRGKELWRLTSAQEKQGERRKEKEEGREQKTNTQELTARIALLLRRLLQGEEPNKGLFECIENTLCFIQGHDRSDPLSDGRLQTLESLTVIRIMHCLGYVGDVADLNGHIVSNGLTLSLLDNLKEKRVSMNRHINSALKESHL